ncbi:MAG: hypothetical protein U0401_05240 [Anaerolineae bacterium]
MAETLRRFPLPLQRLAEVAQRQYAQENQLSTKIEGGKKWLQNFRSVELGLR